MAESKIRFDRSGGFTVLPNGILRESRLGLKTKGLFAILASLPPDWEYSVSGLATVCGVGRDSIRSSLKELEAAGYLERGQAHGDSGRFGGNVYILHETSQTPDVQPLPGFPSTVEPSTAEPSTENPTQLKKDLIQERPNNPPKVPQGGRKRREPKEAPDWKPERFAKFWDFYSHKVRGESKQAAIRAWDKLKPDDATIDQIAMALLWQIKTEEWTRGIGLPYASTYLNNQRWKDQPKAPPEHDPPSSGGWAEDREVF